MYKYISFSFVKKTKLAQVSFQVDYFISIVTIFKSCVPIRTIRVQIKSTITLQSIHLNEATIEKYT